MPVSPHQCCERMELDRIGDCGSVTGFDLTMERCRHCRTYIMDIFYGSSGTPNIVPPGVLGPYEIVRDLVAGAMTDLEKYEVTK